LKTTYRLCGGPLSFIKEVHLETLMTVEHFDTLALISDDDAERGALSVLKDLMEEDPFLLSMRELYHVFMIVKVSSFGPDVPVMVPCPHTILEPEGKGVVACGNSINATYSLAESDLVYAPEGFEIPTVEIALDILGRITDKPVVYTVRPPTMTDELDLLTMYQEQGVQRRDLSDLVNHRDLVLGYARHRMLLYLREKETGAGFADREGRNKALEGLKKLPVSVLRELTKAVNEVDAFGVLSPRHQVVCDKCGKSVTFRTGLLSGVSL
jgi:hypothetical protein